MFKLLRLIIQILV